MDFPEKFIGAGTVYGTLEKPIAAPYLRRTFTVDTVPEKAELGICGLGFYELFVNGEKITRGWLAPYISNPDHLLYYDLYDVLPYLKEGKNVIGVLLGNGFLNNEGGKTWDFDKAPFRSAPMVALKLEMHTGEDTVTVESDENFRTAPSPIWYDDYRNGEYYDARAEIPGWNLPDFDDSGWEAAVAVKPPRGKAFWNDAPPIVTEKELQPVEITTYGDTYIYKFPENNAGVCRLHISGEAGQKLTFTFGEFLEADGKMNRSCITYSEAMQKDIYILKDGEQTYTPTFTYHGFQYVTVEGLTPAQATPDLLTFVVFHTELPTRGGFSCSDPIANRLQEMVRRSDVSNFHHFPTDCPQREKNGWTADAALSSEHMLLNFEPDAAYATWLRSIRAEQREDGKLPGIVPTTGWGYHWGNGPAWDSVLFYLPYFTYKYRHDKKILRDNAQAFMRYLSYVSTHVRKDGLIGYGLGDWCPVNRQWDHYQAPIEFTDTVLTMDLCKKAAYMFDEIGMTAQKVFAEQLQAQLYAAARTHLIDPVRMVAYGDCQTTQAMGIFYDLFTDAEKPTAFKHLLELIHKTDDHMDVGVLGGRVLFHVLTAGGESELAYKMITRTDFPAYGEWAAKGLTTLCENFREINGGLCDSLNHHFWGDISNWFISAVAGIRYNPHGVGGMDIRPAFIESLSYAEGWHIAPEGEIRCRWERTDAGVTLQLTVPDGLNGNIILPQGYVFEDRSQHCLPTRSGTYAVIKE